MVEEKPDEKTYIQESPESSSVHPESPESEVVEKLSDSRWERVWPVLACGAGLFSDGYLNGVSPLFKFFFFFFPFIYIIYFVPLLTLLSLGRWSRQYNLEKDLSHHI